MSDSTTQPRAALGPDEAGRICAAAQIPAVVRTVTETLQASGYAALLVGGAVRDCLLGRAVGDWDVATSATPEEVMAVFDRTIPTGVEHGTVTVLVGRGEERHAVEVTTFRGEGGYRDGRRPEEVTFLRDVREDLERRDFTVNAFAFDPVTGAFHDAFGGLADLHQRVIRAVGDPLARFEEDGLRVIRGLRFCATLGFEMEAETFEAIAPRLGVFAKVARERVRVELFKLLSAPRPGAALTAMWASDMWDHILAPVPDEMLTEVVERVDGAPPNPIIRLSMLLRAAGSQDRVDVAGAIDNLKLSRAERRRCDALVGAVPVDLMSSEAATVRRAAGALGRDVVEDACFVLSLDESARAAVRSLIEGVPLTTSELRVSGGELIQAGLVTPGPKVRDTLGALLAWTFEEPSRNTRDALLARAAEVLAAMDRDVP